MKNKAPIKPLLVAMLMASSSTSLYAAEETGRLYIPISELPAELIGHAPGMQVSVITKGNTRNDGYIYVGNTLSINYKILDTDLDWADPITQQTIEEQIYWYFLKEDGVGNYVPDGDGMPFKTGGLEYVVQPADVGKMVGISIQPITTTGVPNTSDWLNVFDLRNTYVLVPEGQEDQYGGQIAGSNFNKGPVTGENNVTDPVIRDCPVGETCGDVTGAPQDVEIVLYKNIAAPGEEYVYQELPFDQTAENLRVKTWYAVKVFAKQENPANPGEFIRTDKNLTEQYQNDIVWSLVDAQNASNKQVVKATFNPLRKQMEFKTQQFNDQQSPDNGTTQPASLAQSALHASQQGMKFEITVNF